MARKKVEEEVKEVKLRSEAYDKHDNEKLELRDEENDAVMWGFVIGFGLFFILLIIIVTLIH